MKPHLLTLARTGLVVAGLLHLNACSNSAYRPMTSTRESAGGARATPQTHRTGLGTATGYERNDSVYDVAFQRKSPDHPDAVASFHYNDKAGADAMIQMLGGKPHPQSGAFRIAGDRIEVSLEELYGRRMDWMEADGRIIVIGKPGADYRIRLKNRTKDPVAVVVSVDGLDVITSKPANFSNSGYFISAKSTISIEGFRKNADSVRTFRFSRVDQSEAMKKGGESAARNVGVIGVAVFEEDKLASQAARLREGTVRDSALAFPGAR